MGGGFNANSLALFTALSPAGAVAFFLLAVFLLTKRGLADEARSRVSRFMGISLAVSWAGFIASATHLGTPANALHVIWGVGRSPLSNEVAAAVLFLFFAGVFWLDAFREKQSRVLSNALLAAAMVSAVALVLFSSLAYSVDTVPSWYTWHTPVNLWLCALFAGPALAAFVLQAARCPARRWPWVFMIMAVVFLVVSTAALGAQLSFFQGVQNAVVRAADLVPHHGAIVAAHAVLGVLGLAAQAHGMRVSVSHVRGMTFSVIGCVLVFVTAVLARLPFYWSYLSVGF